MTSRRLHTLTLFIALMPLAAKAEPFAGVTNSRDAVDGAAQIPVSATSAFAPVTDPRDTMPMAPPPPVAAAPINDRIVVTNPIATPKPVTPTAPGPTLPPLVKRAVAQQVTEAAPGILLVQPANLPDVPMNTNGTLNGAMFHDRTETLTPNGIVDDQPDPKGTISFGGTAAVTTPTAPETPVAARPTPTTVWVTTPVTTSPDTPVSATVPAPMAVKVISASDIPGGVVAASPSIAVSAGIPISGTVSGTTPVKKFIGPIAAGLVFTADDLALSAKTKQALDSFSRLTHGQVLGSLTITQRTVAPLNALNEIADARRKAILEALRQAGVIGSQTRIAEVRVRVTTPQSHTTLVGTL